MSSTKRLTVCSLNTLLFFAASTTFALDVVPAPPAVEPVAVVDEAVPPMPGADSPCGMAVENGCLADAGCCDYQPEATCCMPCVHVCCCCGHAGCTMPGIHARRHNGKLKWCRVWSTGDMYQHFAYYPAHHGTYYFRPYNYQNVLQHKADVVMLGGDMEHPYSVAMFDSIYESYYANSPRPIQPEPAIDDVPNANLLPSLEDLLKSK